MDFNFSFDHVAALSNTTNATNDGLLYRWNGHAVTPTQWCTDYRPCWVFGGQSDPAFVLSQPSSTFFVMFLALQCIVIGVYILHQREYRGQLQFSRVYWGFGMLLWGLGAFFAGLSYEMLEWELKCRDREYCILYSWMEMVYVVWQVAAMDFLALGEAIRVLRSPLVVFRIGVYAVFNLLTYATLSTVGALTGIQALLSFELVVLFGFPTMGMALCISFIAWQRTPWGTCKNDKKIATYMGIFYSWVVMVLSGVAYVVYNRFGPEEWLWDTYRISFTGNHVLHIILIVWAFMVAFQAPFMVDSAKLRENIAGAFDTTKKTK
ncbi:hypothetical protein DIPPA_13486 [Diplonema papillatum]|nr:hypothetical protein DIPPA_13486 [Diplonema papillatum]|eukprot:gene9064-14035_t